MHYSPLATGAGLFILWHAIPRDSPTGLIARVLIDGAGLVFLMILAWAILANLYGAARWSLPWPRRAVGRHGSASNLHRLR
ncbi:MULTISPECIES: hypothetical protein [Actinomyces]|uniref:Uncharacterized protein n=2 Tax=Actinomyces TaxID=1654 RepID=A0A853EKP9_9ACTO|nr:MULTISPECIES: hypothetical protein [Actinomyces]MBF0696253.1 hypothetical protein [Actinomyces bowdenii]MCR2052634.1 hypothetical protein [Actinomyces bowdenii]NYS68426.1 hypothetical protein [Actinomyces bowdenii]BDA63255.1 hypothetical protein MANAM107_00890 [Actinomyces capricornis]